MKPINLKEYKDIIKEIMRNGLELEFQFFVYDKNYIIACSKEPWYCDIRKQWIGYGKTKLIESLPEGIDFNIEESLRDRHLIQAEIYMDNFEAKIKPKTSTELLQRAIDLQAERGKQYDSETSQERSMASIIQAFNAITGRELTESEGWLLMVLLKAKRAFTNTKEPHRDSFEDLISYASLMGECALTGEKDDF